VDWKIVGTPIPPEQPEAPKLIVRSAGVGLIVGILSILGGSFWPVVGPWLVAAIIAFSLLAPYWHASLDQSKRDDIRKLYER
jgi:hypothetical protein